MRELTVERYQSRKRKPGTVAKARAKRRRAEAPVAAKVRAQCVERDGYCRIGSMGSDQFNDQFSADLFVPALADGCEGPSEWAHLWDKKRAKTRGMAPEQRHTTQDSAMLCRTHHDRYDGRATPKLKIRPLTTHGADGALSFSGETGDGSSGVSPQEQRET